MPFEYYACNLIAFSIEKQNRLTKNNVSVKLGPICLKIAAVISANYKLQVVQVYMNALLVHNTAITRFMYRNHTTIYSL